MQAPGSIPKPATSTVTGLLTFKSATFTNSDELTDTRRVMDPILGVRLLYKLIKETDKE